MVSWFQIVSNVIQIALILLLGDDQRTLIQSNINQIFFAAISPVFATNKSVAEAGRPTRTRSMLRVRFCVGRAATGNKIERRWAERITPCLAGPSAKPLALSLRRVRQASLHLFSSFISRFS